MMDIKYRILGLDYTIQLSLSGIIVVERPPIRSFDAFEELPSSVAQSFGFLWCVLSLSRIHAYRFQLRCSTKSSKGVPAV